MDHAKNPDFKQIFDGWKEICALGWVHVEVVDSAVSVNICPCNQGQIYISLFALLHQMLSHIFQTQLISYQLEWFTVRIHYKLAINKKRAVSNGREGERSQTHNDYMMSDNKRMIFSPERILYDWYTNMIAYFKRWIIRHQQCCFSLTNSNTTDLTLNYC